MSHLNKNKYADKNKSLKFFSKSLALISIAGHFYKEIYKMLTY
jgi:hypothetical protein